MVGVAHPACSVLLAAGALVNARDRSGRSPLHAACQYDADGATIPVLLRAGAAAQAEDDDGAAPGAAGTLTRRLWRAAMC